MSSRPLAALDRFFYPPAPAERLALLRALVGAYSVVFLLVRAPAFLNVSSLPHFVPVGPVSVLGAPLPAFVHVGLFGVTLGAGVLFALGLFYRASGPLFAVLMLWLTSYRSSWGMLFHTENLLCLHLVLLGAAPAADALSWRKPSTASEPDGRYGWALRAMSLITVAAYFLAGLAKLKIAGFDWANGSILRTHIAYDNLRKIELGSVHAPLGVLLVRASWLFPPVAFATLLLELGGFASFVHRRAALVWCSGVWLFHVGVALLMAIAFPYPLAVIPFLTFFEPEKTWLGRLAQKLFASKSAEPTATPA
jgi:hypothetical protein